MSEHIHKCGFNPPPQNMLEATFYPKRPEEPANGDGCGHEFRHGDNCKGDQQAHMCPSCGKGPWLSKYYDPSYPEGERYHPAAREQK